LIARDPTKIGCCSLAQEIMTCASFTCLFGDGVITLREIRWSM
jgi:hypothetical protein